MNAQQYEKVKSSKGFIAALDQSGGSTPKALSLYGIKPEEYSGDQQMFDLMHAMRTRIVNSPAFNGDRVLAAILFEQTMDREISGRGTADYLWSVKQVVPFVKVDKGLADEANGVQLMKPMPDLDALLARAKAKGVFGTKMRSVINRADAKGIESVVAQQFTIAKQILAAGLMPIVEPEVNIKAPDKEDAERLLKAAILKQLDTLGAQQQVMLKLTIPSVDDFYAGPRQASESVARRGALRRLLSRRREQALARNHGVIASFSRALTEGLTAQQSDEEFNKALDASIGSIYEGIGNLRHTASGRWHHSYRRRPQWFRSAPVSKTGGSSDPACGAGAAVTVARTRNIARRISAMPGSDSAGDGSAVAVGAKASAPL
jgi:fructose-bisphosphate aldolase class I